MADFADRNMTDLLDELETREPRDKAACWIVLTDALLNLTNEERAAAWRGASDDADKRLTASRARLDQIQAELADTLVVADHLRRRLEGDERA